MIAFNDIKVKIDIANLSTASPKWSKKKFPYPHHRLYCPADGEAILFQNDAKYILKPGFIYLIPAFTMVETICKNFFTHYYIHFQLYSSDALDLFTIYEPSTKLKTSSKTYELFDTIIDHYDKHTPYTTMMTMSAMYQLIGPFFKDCNPPKEELIRFEPVLNYIENNLDNKITNEQLANVMGLNKVYFNNLFTKNFLTSPNQYVIKKRLEKAQTLLLSTNYNINKIATLSGFDNNMYFSRVFKSKTGITPTEYRARNN